MDRLVSDHAVLEIGGMTCAACATRIEKALRKIEGVTDANVNLATEKATIIAPGVPIETLVSAVRKAGYEARQKDDANASQSAKGEGAWRWILGMVLTAPLTAPMILDAFSVHWMLPVACQWLAASVVEFVLGARFFVGAWKALRSGSANMDVLVALGTLAAYGLSLYLWRSGASGHHLYFESAAAVITLVLLGKWLEARAKARTLTALRALEDLKPSVATVMRDGTAIDVSLARVGPGDLVRVAAGQRIPVDGEVVDGASEVDESMVTGESTAIAKAIGARVTAGTLNGAGMLMVRTTAVGGQTLLARIIDLVESAQAEKAPIQRLVDRVSGVFVPVVLVITACTALGWMIQTGNFEVALINAVSVAVIACPCALGLATPAALMAGTGAAARAGILIKDIDALETAGRIDVVALDKTGTLTVGRPVLTDMAGDPAALRLAWSTQGGSTHPLARALSEAAKARSLEEEPVRDVRVVAGQGMMATSDGQPILVGSARFMTEQAIAIEGLNDEAQRLRAEGKTLSWVARAGRCLGLLAFSDVMRPEAPEAVRELASMGLATVLVTGDHATSAKVIAERAAISQVHAEVLPDQKAALVVAMQKEGKTIAMVGDGINDAPALATADLGIAMASGSDLALETAAIALMRNDLRLVPAAIDISRRTTHKIRQNLTWAFAYNVIGIPLAALGYLNPVLAGAAMAASSVSVVTNALGLKRWRPAFMSRERIVSSGAPPPQNATGAGAGISAG